MITFLCFLCRLLHTYVSAHGGTFDGVENKSLRTFLSTSRRARARPGESGNELGLGANELQVLENALALVVVQAPLTVYLGFCVTV